ncbi:Uncharacterised protein [Mycobacteroides abscessus subsp. bolletii]|jgi:hypothetical protein|uniref:Uncharacterized protein n=1 Tax=Mycobacteroides abscessus subsp. bolletii TaxID=319705 RepID=A0A9Q7SC55_9MYCO|nr:MULTISPECIES: hypothetical protein [Mycobacteroides]MDO3334949.1 hypothetical protein [Mycobacteroides abscessus subsp. bolletii]OHU23826.1 hypothetical protein BKG77_09570 [Mycobacteroides chelonae]QSM90266.1 hypothetical protein I3U44_06145 [Mycobacteroides abscessus subsp. bolletii]SHU36566.1 Uncharacterised protein [Mycobacteroides abscessus subsp. bolletii]SHV35149.1 Uncharacterised protein [Mycobacteroides abscessus subsp. bolletii]
MPGESGLDMNELHLAPGAATKVSQEFSAAVDKLEALRSEAGAFQSDLGMGTCAEGASWNDALRDLVAGDSDSVVAVIDAHIKTVRTWAEWAKVAQNEYDNTEHRNAEAFEQLRGDTIDSNGLGVYPPPTTP